MFFHLIKHSFRNLIRYRSYSLINLLGLTIGVITLVIIALWVKYEISFDRNTENQDRVYRITVEVNEPNGYKSHFARSWQTWISQMPEHFPAIEAMARFSPFSRTAVRLGEIKFNSDRVFQGNPDILKVFKFDFLSGNPEHALRTPKKLIIAESLARKYFNDSEIYGKTLDIAGIYDTAFTSYQVSGVYRDFPVNSHFHPEIILSMDNPDHFEGWAYTYFLLRQNANPESITGNFTDFADKYLPEDQKKTSVIHLERLDRIHLHSKKDREIENNGEARMVLSFSAIGITIFTLGLINYINLNLALLLRRKKSLVIGKIFGARSSDLFLSFFTEAVLLNLIVLLMSVTIILTGRYFISDFISPDYISANIGFILFSSVILGLSTCLIVTISQMAVMFRPVARAALLKPQHMDSVEVLGSKNPFFKKILVVVQYTASVVLIIVAIYFNRQKDFMLGYRMGAGDFPVMVLDNLNWQIKDRYFQFRNLLMGNPSIKDVTGTMEEPSGQFMDALPFEMTGVSNDKNDRFLYVSPVDDNFFNFFNLKISGGNNFSKYDPVTGKEEYIINETAMKFLGFTDPEQVIGRNFKPIFDIQGIFKGGIIVGVVKDFHFSTMKEKIKPLVFFPKPIWYWTFLIKLQNTQASGGVRAVKTAWEQVYPEYAFDYSYLDEFYLTAYKSEISQAKLSGYFMIIAIFIACMGLFGLASINIEQRTREIGIRKVIGASSFGIFLMLNREFTIWVTVAVLLSFPLAGYLLRLWSENFEYNAGLTWWNFALPGILALFVAWLTVGYRSIKASIKNPAEVINRE
jgi:putative ABC transport system permease protein